MEKVDFDGDGIISTDPQNTGWFSTENGESRATQQSPKKYCVEKPP